MLYDTSSLIFLSTLSLRRATRLGLLGWLRVLISIHALLAESDSPCCGWLEVIYYFYPRSPCGERLASPFSIFWICHFYPRSPCGERLQTSKLCNPLLTFLSTLSLRRATNTRTYRVYCPAFLSTLSLRRATCFSIPYRLKVTISIHALLAESDPGLSGE